MKKKIIEAIPWIAKNSRKKDGYNIEAQVRDIDGEQTLIIDISGKKPVMRMAMTKRDHATLFIQPADDCKKEGWHQHVFDKGYLRWYRKYDMSEASKNLINTFLEARYSDWAHAVQSHQRSINNAKGENYRKKVWDRRLAKIKEDTGSLKPFTKKFEKWGIKQVEAHYMQVLPYYGKKETTGICTNCHETVTIQKNAEPKKCPCCHKRVTLIHTKKEINGYRDDKELILLQKYGSKLVERHCIARRDLVNNFEKYRVWEKGCFVYDGKAINTYYKKADWYGNSFWDDVNCYGMYKEHLNPGIAYPFDNILKNTEYKYSGLEYIDRPVEPLNYLARYTKMPQIEILAKIGMTNLAVEISENNMAKTYKKPWEMLMVSKEEFNRMQKTNPNIAGLKWYQYEHEMNARIDDEDIDFLSRMSISPEQLSFITPLMTVKKIKNYLEKQMIVSGYDTYHNIVNSWRDYMDMGKVAKKDMTLEQNYKPANIKAAHDDLANVKAIEDRSDELLSLFPILPEVLSTLQKYSYADENYSIVVPTDVKDILREGKILGHCLDRSNIYFDRICRKESFIVFLRKNTDLDMPYYTLEIEPDGTTRQKRTMGDRQNEDFKKDCIPFIRKWQKDLKKKLSREDSDLASVSAELRVAEFKKLREDNTKIWHGVLAGQLLADVLEADLMLA